ncbi:hypothetical protein NPIL_434281 [Nephila pilipes]|uniref:Uncharacterized protein n=1 Tax=Nephila pilipes TaxID=299642 RepID=A0A8X6NF45_NEPPI|nr:hypothetical protein NPIL_434281 [Nephila pilipes]
MLHLRKRGYVLGGGVLSPVSRGRGRVGIVGEHRWEWRAGPGSCCLGGRPETPRPHSIQEVVWVTRKEGWKEGRLEHSGVANPFLKSLLEPSDMQLLASHPNQSHYFQKRFFSDFTKFLNIVSALTNQGVVISQKISSLEDSIQL